MRIRSRLAALLPGLLLAGCFNPDDIFPVKGSVVSVDGVEGLTVELLRDSHADVSLAGCDAASPFKTTTTAADGTFRFDLFRAEAQSLSQRGFFCFRVRVHFPSGAEAYADLAGLGGETTLTPFDDWRAQPSVAGEVVHFVPVRDVAEADDAGVSLDHRLRVFAGLAGGIAWSAGDRFLADGFDLSRTTRKPLRLTPELLEDFATAAEFDAVLLVPLDPSLLEGAISRQNAWPVSLRSAGGLSVTGSLVPSSRGVACADVASPCPLTDGLLQPIDLEFRQSLTLERPDAGPLTSIVMRELSVGAPVVGVQLFGVDGGLVQTLSHTLPLPLIDSYAAAARRTGDGGFEFGNIPPQWTVIAVDAGQDIAKVTFRFPSGAQGCSEISLFP